MSASIPEENVAHTLSKSTKGNPESVLAAFDEACTQRWQMNVGKYKGKALDDAVIARKPQSVLELGTFCGYSTVRIARLLNPGARLYTVDPNEKTTDLAKKIVEQAGLLNRVEFIAGYSSEVISQMAERHGVVAFDLVFVDHEKELYLSDVKLLETCGLLRKGSVVVADNILVPGAPDYAEYVRGCSKYTSTSHMFELEPSPGRKIKDIIEVSVYQEGH
eukprot:m.309586 g.309586  ORF g.309586 m.309586 type:complete len:219 (+) comp47012_c0_seq1:67-723(+)